MTDCEKMTYFWLGFFAGMAVIVFLVWLFESIAEQIKKDDQQN